MSIILLKTSCYVLTVHVENFMSPHSRKPIKGNVSCKGKVIPLQARCGPQSA